MPVQAEYAWNVKRVFVEKKLKKPIIRKSGKVISWVKIPIWTYRLFLTGEFAFTRAFRCVPVVRDKELSWSISILTEPQKPLWPMLELRPDPKARAAWKRWATMTEAEFSLWLAKVLGPERAAAALGKPDAASLPTLIS